MKYYCVKCGAQIHQNEFDRELEIVECRNCGTEQELQQLVRIEDNHKTQLMLAPPSKSKIDVYRYSDSVMEITIPRSGLKPENLFVLGFSVVWLSFVAFWTLMAASASILFAMFSIPFWIVGVSMLYSLTKVALEKQEIELNGRTMKIKKTRLLNSRTEEFPLMDVDQIKMEKLGNTKRFTTASKLNHLGNKNFKIPTIKHGKETETLLEYGTEEEKKWVVNLLNEYMVKIHGKDV